MSTAAALRSTSEPRRACRPKSASTEIFRNRRASQGRSTAYRFVASRDFAYAYGKSRQDRQSLQTDPVGYEDDLNLYAYVRNDPLNAIDPTGRQLVNPIPGGEPRGCDPAGCGNHGAPRGEREHNGFDIAGEAGTEVVAPISGAIRIIDAIYANDEPDFEGVEITNYGDDPSDADDTRASVFYVEPSVQTGDQVQQGDAIGTLQDRAGEGDAPGMQNHGHLRVIIGDEQVDPEPLIEDLER